MIVIVRARQHFGCEVVHCGRKVWVLGHVQVRLSGHCRWRLSSGVSLAEVCEMLDVNQGREVDHKCRASREDWHPSHAESANKVDSPAVDIAYPVQLQQRLAVIVSSTIHFLWAFQWLGAVWLWCKYAGLHRIMPYGKRPVVKVYWVCVSRGGHVKSHKGYCVKPREATYIKPNLALRPRT
jgi:hypothetical protein